MFSFKSRVKNIFCIFKLLLIYRKNLINIICFLWDINLEILGHYYSRSILEIENLSTKQKQKIVVNISSQDGCPRASSSGHYSTVPCIQIFWGSETRWALDFLKANPGLRADVALEVTRFDGLPGRTQNQQQADDCWTRARVIGIIICEKVSKGETGPISAYSFLWPDVEGACKSKIQL